jgi:hypothetical protein
VASWSQAAGSRLAGEWGMDCDLRKGGRWPRDSVAIYTTNIGLGALGCYMNFGP